MSTLIAVLKVAPELIGLFVAIWRYVVAAKDREIGAQEAALDAITKATAAVQQSTLIRAEVEKDHAAHPNDEGGFDTSFKRAD